MIEPNRFEAHLRRAPGTNYMVAIGAQHLACLPNTEEYIGSCSKLGRVFW